MSYLNGQFRPQRSSISPFVNVFNPVDCSRVYRGWGIELMKLQKKNSIKAECEQCPSSHKDTTKEQTGRLAKVC